MIVYILTLRENNESAKLIKNFGVFSKRSLCMNYIIQHRATDITLKGGRFTFTSVEELNEQEQAIDFNPAMLKIFENGFYIVVAEASLLK